MWCCALIGRIHGNGDQEVEVRVALLTITPSGPPQKFEFPIPTTLDCMGLEIDQHQCFIAMGTQANHSASQSLTPHL